MPIQLIRPSSTVSAIETPGETGWGYLVNALTGQAPNRVIFLNEVGQNVPDPYTLSYIADQIEAGSVWVDWTRIPFSSSSNLGRGALSTFLGLLGHPLENIEFPLVDGTPTVSTTSPLSGILINPAAVVSPTHLVEYGHGVYNPQPGTSYLASFAVLHGKGAYIYASWMEDTIFGIPDGNTSGVSATDYIPFLLSTISALPTPSNITTGLPPNCGDKYGTYMGTYPQEDVEPGHYLYTRYADDVKINTVVNADCGNPVIYTYNISGQPSHIPTTSSGSGNSSGGTTTTSPVDVHVYGGSGSSAPSTPKMTTASYIIIGAAALGVGYLIWAGNQS